MAMTNIEWLRYFSVFAQTGSFASAADQLHLTQQAMSNAMAGLERHFGQKLIERGHRSSRLTPAGDVLLQECRPLLDGMANLERRMLDLKTGDPAGPVRIAGVSWITNYLLPQLLADVIERFPGIEPQIFGMGASEVEGLVLAGHLDIGLVVSEVQQPELSAVEAFRTSYVIAGAPQPKVPWSELRYVAPKPFIAGRQPELELAVHQHLESKWPSERYPRQIVAYVEHLETALNLCEAGIGASYLPEIAVRERIRQGRLAIVADPPCSYAEPVYVVWRKGVRPTPAVREVIQALKGLAVAD
jgi:DNA-binding transcriptional LysR family regulator